ncbi:MAG: cyclic pyranopterin monophosphate synthase MoaC [Clostridia bacterium]|nr:cyclic pyranopterin monophosphate synthase MoaC [Clostridia bacterium]
MSTIPAIAFAAYSGTGKTTLIEKLIHSLKKRGMRLAVIKQDAHRIELDKEGKDSWRYARAGADVVMVSGPEKTALIDHRESTLAQNLLRIENVDLILVEGYKNGTLPVIGICRAATGQDFPEALDRFIAVVTDRQDVQTDIPHFGMEDIEDIADFILSHAVHHRMGVKNEADFTHFSEQGRAKMVDVGDKAPTRRTAVAGARVLVSRDTFELIKPGGMKKGDVLTVAQIAGVMGAKRMPALIPMCHPIMITGINLELRLNEARCAVEILATVSCDGKTGVEMEALTAVSTAALTVYDMCKAVQKDMVITDIRLITKTGGVHGDFHRKDD